MNLFEKTFAKEFATAKKEIDKKKQVATAEYERLTKLEPTKELEAEIKKIEAIKKDTEVKKEQLETLESASTGLTEELRLVFDRKLITKQYMISEEVAAVVDTNYKRLKTINPKVKIGALVELALVTYFGLDDTETKERLGMKKDRGNS